VPETGKRNRGSLSGKSTACPGLDPGMDLFGVSLSE
jgi:hypothetical protein